MTRTEKLDAERAHRRIVLELENRTLMLLTHGGMLLVLGLMMVLTGAPRPTEEWFGPWSRLVVGGAGMLCGLTALVGVALTDDSRRGYRLLLAGTISGMVWHVGLSLTYAWAVSESRLEILAPGEALDSAISNRGYIPFVYLGYVLLIGIHARTLVKLGPPPR